MIEKMQPVKTCSITGCVRTSDMEGISFFNFPCKKQLFLQWTRFTKKSLIYDLSASFVCSAHFSSEDYEDDNGERLKDSAVPTLFDQETIDLCITKTKYPDEKVKTVFIKDEMTLNNVEVKYIKEEDVAYIKEEEVEYVEEPYFEVEIQDEPIFTEPMSNEGINKVETSESSTYHKNGEIMEISVPNQLINEDTIVEISESGLIDESTIVEIVDPTAEPVEETAVKTKRPKKRKVVKVQQSPKKKVSNAQVVTPVTVTFQLCRFCTKQIEAEADGIDIFAGETATEIAEMLKVVIPGKVNEDDGLPGGMCTTCLDKLKQCYDIMIMFLSADAYFRNREFITLPRPSNHKNNNFQTLGDEEPELNGNDLSNAIVIENSEDLEEVMDFNKTEKVQDDQNCDIIISGPEKHLCASCPQTFESLTALVLHKYTTHKVATGKSKGQYMCPKCPLVFSMLQALKLHIQLKHPSTNKMYMCSDCKLGFKHKHLLDNHKKNNHKKHICEVCGKPFLSMLSLKRHVETHYDLDDETNDDAHLCWICGKSYSLKQNLQNHIHTHFGIQTSGYPCLVCGRRLESVGELRVHLETHKEKEKNFKCPKCDKVFVTRSLLLQHSDTHISESLFICEVCGKAFKKSSTLNRHRQNHLNGRDIEEPVFVKTYRRNEVDLDIYECEICGKKIVSRLSYKYHMSKHTGDKKPFDCEDCGMTFAKVQGYKTHALIHRGEFPFVCDKCGKGFRTKRTLQQHEVVHTDERPFSCNHCHLAFKRMDSLYMHQAVHSGKRPFSCTMCGKTFVRKQDTRTHLIRFHKLHNSEVDAYILKVLESETDDSNFPFTQEDYFTEYISVGNSLEVETTENVNNLN